MDDVANEVVRSMLVAPFMPHAPTTGHKYLLYCPVKGSECEGEFFDEDRLFDVAVNDWTDSDVPWDSAEYVFRTKGHKWPGIVQNLHQIEKKYDYYAFFDFDVHVTTDDINRLFQVGAALDLDLYQAALSRDSISDYPHLIASPRSLARTTMFVEVMMPVFSRVALERCRWTFGESISGYGLDFLWSKVLEGKRMAVIDAVIARHVRPIQSRQWKLETGMTPLDELKHILTKYQIKTPGFFNTSASSARENRKSETRRL